MLPGLTALAIAGLEPSLLLASLISLAYVAVAITRLRRFGIRARTAIA
jgi:hypothetical protein